MSAMTVTKENLRELLESDKPVLLDFWAKWCPPCRMVSPIVDEIASEISHARVGKVDIDEQPELAEAFKVMSIPTLAVIKNGKVVHKTVGFRPKASILSMLEAST